MKPLVVLLFCIVSSHLSSQFRIEKIGAFAGMHRITASYNYQKYDSWIKKTRTLTRQRVGAKIAYPVVGRLSMETGLLMDNLTYKNKEDNPSYYILRTDSAIALEQHSMVKIGIPMTLLFRTYKTEACVTFLKLTLNNQVSVFEKEQFSEETTDFNLRQTTTSQLSSSRSGFDYSNTDLEFSFGTYLNIKGIDAQFAIEPKFSLLNYVAANEINSNPDLYLYDDHTRVFGAIGFEVTMYKVLE